jgi:hypothetical protein
MKQFRRGGTNPAFSGLLLAVRNIVRESLKTGEPLPEEIPYSYIRDLSFVDPQPN